VLGNDLFIGGSFTRLTYAGTSIEVNGIARWDGNTWSGLGSGGGSGVGGDAARVWALATLAGDLYVGGRFTRVNSGGMTVNANGIARWSPTTSTWSAVGSGGGNGVISGNNAAGSVRALATQGQSLFVGGSFSRANAGGSEVVASNVARWNGSSWSGVGSDGGHGVSGQVYALALVGPELYAGGLLQRANVGGPEIPVNNLARWNGSQWSRVGNSGGDGLGHPNGWTRAGVWALAASGNDLYAGGEFFWANEGGAVVPANQIARWDGTRWHSLGSGGGNGVFNDPSLSAVVSALAVLGGQLYVGGFFLQANAGGPAVAANNIARWDGSSWSSVASGQNGTSRSVLALGAYGNDLIAGGSFGRAGSTATSNLAAFGIADTSSTTISSTVPAPSAPGEPVRIRVLVTADTAPTSGHVTVTGAPGGSCSDLTLTVISATTSEAECTIRWNTTGSPTLTAWYTGGSRAATSWQPSRSAPFGHTVSPLFSDGFEQGP
jgi:hypothetical protein